MQFNSGDLAINFTAEGINTSGDKAKSIPLSHLSSARMKIVNDIVKASNGSKSKLKKIVDSILLSKDAFPILQSYVSSKGYVPESNPVSLAVQATICRTEDIAYCAAANDLLDTDALVLLEASEDEAKELSMPNANEILPVDIMAAMVLGIDYIKEQHKRYGGSGNIKGVSKSFHDHSKDYDGFDLNIFDLIGDVTQADPLFNSQCAQDRNVSQYNTYPYKLYNSFDDYDDEPWADFSTSGTGTQSSSGGGFFGFLDKLFGSVGKLGETVKKFGSDVGSGIYDAREGVAQTASYSTRQAITDNLPLILGIAAIIIFGIFIAIYAATKNK